MLLELIAIILIVFGVFLIFRGLTETYEKPYEVEHEFEEFIEPEFEEEDWRKKKKRKTEVKTGGVILVGPIPIVFGESRFAVYALILTIILMLMVFLLMFAPYWR